MHFLSRAQLSMTSESVFKASDYHSRQHLLPLRSRREASDDRSMQKSDLAAGDAKEHLPPGVNSTIKLKKRKISQAQPSIDNMTSTQRKNVVVQRGLLSAHPMKNMHIKSRKHDEATFGDVKEDLFTVSKHGRS